MGLYSAKYNSPFDTSESRKSLDTEPKAMHLKPSRYLTSRASVFMGLTVISMDLSLFFAAHIGWTLAAYIAVFILWLVSLRFITDRRFTPAMLFVICLVMQLPSMLFPKLFAVTFPETSIPFALGLFTLNAMKEDNREDATAPGILKECVIPYIFASGASITGFFGSELFERKYIFEEIIISVMFLILLAYVISKSGGAPYFFTSKKLAEFWDIPVADFRETLTFIKAKVRFALILILDIILAFVLDTFIPDRKLFLLICLPACLVIMLAAVYIAGSKAKDIESFFGGRFLVYELFIASGAVASLFINAERPGIKAMLIIFAVIVISDILLTSLFAVIRRRQIFVSRSKYLDGLLFMMTLVALFVMIAESALYGIIPL